MLRKPLLMTILILSGVLQFVPAALAQGKETFYQVTAIEVQGNPNVPSEEILSVITAKVGSQVSQQVLMDDLKAIYGTGYFQDVTLSSEPYKKGTRIIFKVVENPVLKSVRIEGNTVFSLEELSHYFEDQKGKILNLRNLKKGIDDINKRYMDAGYVLAQVIKVEPTPDGELRIVIAEGVVDQVEVLGNTKTNSVVIMRAMDTKPGKVLNRQVLQKDIQRLYNLGIFEDVAVTPEPSATTGHVNLKVTIKEGRAGNLSLSIGSSSQTGFFGGVGLELSNFEGMNRQIKLNAQVGQLQTLYYLSYFDPWIDNERTSFGSSLYSQQTVNNIGFFTELRNGGSLRIGRPIGDYWRVEVAPKMETILIQSTSDGTPVTSKTVSGTDRDALNSLTLAAVYDTRDVVMKPHNGWYDRFSTEKAGGLFGGDLNYSRYIGSLSYFIPAGDLQTYSLRLQGGTVVGTVPVTELFYVGGVNTIRGYPDLFFSGTNMVVASAEYQFPLFSPVDGAIFVDTGTAYSGAQASTFHTSYGIGIRFDTPLGAIRLDYGFPLDPGLPGKFEFGIGPRF